MCVVLCCFVCVLCVLCVCVSFVLSGPLEGLETRGSQGRLTVRRFLRRFNARKEPRGARGPCLPGGLVRRVRARPERLRPRGALPG